MMESIVFIGSVLLVGVLTILFYDKLKKYFDTILTTSGAFLMGVTFIHLIPETLEQSSIKNLGVFILLGFFIQILLDFLSKGVEHGHVHQQKTISGSIVVLIGLCIHSFLEGMPLQYYAEGSHDHGHVSNHLFFAVLMHKMPEAFSLTALLLISGVDKIKTFLFLFLFSIMTPLGLGTYDLMPKNWIQYYPIVVCVVIGLLLHISTTILFEIDKGGHHNFSFKKLIAISVGFALALITIH